MFKSNKSAIAEIRSEIAETEALMDSLRPIMDFWSSLPQSTFNKTMLDLNVQLYQATLQKYSIQKDLLNVLITKQTLLNKINPFKKK